MDYHKNARFTVHSRELLAKMVVVEGCTQQAAVRAFHVSAKTVGK
jgi:transposase